MILLAQHPKWRLSGIRAAEAEARAASVFMTAVAVVNPVCLA